MSIGASGSQTKTQAIVETVWGTTPATPTFLQLPIESNTLQLSKTTLTDNTLRFDRMGGDVRGGMKKVDGDIKFNYRRGDFDTLLENLFRGAWTSNVLKAGVTPKYHSIEVGYTDINQFSVFSGLAGDTFTISVKPNSLVSSSMTFMGKSQSAFAGVSYATVSTATTGNEAFDSFTGSMKEGGSSIATVTAIDVTLTNNLSESNVIFSDSRAGITAGNVIVTGTLVAQFLDATLYNKFLNNTSSSLEFTLIDPTGKSHTYLVPKIVYTSGDISPTGPDELTISLKFNSQYDSTTGTKLQITRTI